jgi:hypothetical protein
MVLRHLFFVSYWCFTVLCDARTQATQFLNASSARFDGTVADTLRRAASEAAQCADALADAFRTRRGFFGPWSGKAFEDWTPEVRRYECDLLESARRLDSAMRNRLDEAIAAMR